MQKKRLTNILIGAVFLVQFVCIFTRFDFWPLTNYPMFPGLMGREDVLVFQLKAILPGGREIKLPHTGWPSMPNYSDAFVAQDQHQLLLQALSDYQTYRRRYDQELPAVAESLILTRLGGSVTDTELRPIDSFYFLISPGKNEIEKIDR